VGAAHGGNFSRWSGHSLRPNGGWNETASFRLAVLERLAAKTGDGRYRYVAHKLLNYLRYQSPEFSVDTYRLDASSSWHIALAWLFADDSVKPVQPEAGSCWDKRIETARVPVADKKHIERLLGNSDPRTNCGHICCGWFLTGKEWPDKLVLRSGWNPGDLFALVNCIRPVFRRTRAVSWDWIVGARPSRRSPPARALPWRTAL